MDFKKILVNERGMQHPLWLVDFNTTTKSTQYGLLLPRNFTDRVEIQLLFWSSFGFRAC